jgi:hypothetical protein
MSRVVGDTRFATRKHTVPFSMRVRFLLHDSHDLHQLGERLIAEPLPQPIRHLHCLAEVPLSFWGSIEYSGAAASDLC